MYGVMYVQVWMDGQNQASERAVRHACTSKRELKGTGHVLLLIGDGKGNHKAPPGSQSLSLVLASQSIV